MEDSKYKFLWGVATSSYQVEGGISNNDWDYFTRSDSIKKGYLLLQNQAYFTKEEIKFIYNPPGKLSNSGSRNIMKVIFD